MKTKLLLLFQILTLTVLAQAPKLINYQGIARDSIGNPLPNKTLKMTFELLQGSGQTSVFTETQTINTNSLGLFTTQIGKINSTGLDAVNFEGGVLTLKIGVDPNGGNTFFNLGTQTLVSVPFSMHAQSVPVTYTNNVLTIGKTSFTLNGTGAIYTASTGISIVSNSIITNTAPDQTVTMTPGNSNVNITGTYPDFTVSASPSITLIAPTTLSITNGNTVDITPGLTFSNGILSVGNVNNTVSIPGSTTSLVGSGAANVATLGVNSFSIDVPQPTLTVNGNSLSINGGNTVTLPSTPNTSVVGGGAVSVATLAANSYSISAAMPSLAISGNSLNIIGSNTVVLPTAPNTSLIGTGAANVATLGTNNYSIDVPTPTITPGTNVTVGGAYPNFTVNAAPTLSLLSPNTLSITGGNTVAIAPSLVMSGNTLQVGPASNTVVVPSGTFVPLVIVPMGVATGTQTGNTYSLEVAPSSVIITTLQGPTSVQTLSPNNFSINIQPPVSQSLTMLSANTLSITGGNSVTLPSAPNTSLIGTGAANVATLGTNSYSIDVPVPNLTISGNSLSVNGGNTVTLPSAAAQSLAVNGQSLNITGANTITLPSASLIGTGAANVATLGANSYSIDVPVPNLSITGNSLSVNGGNTVTLPSATAQSLAVNGQSLNITGANTITLPSASLIGTGAANVATLGANSYSIDVPVPNLSITGNSLSVNGGNTVTLPTAAAQSLAVNGQSLNITGANTITLPSASLIGTGAANVATLGTNSYSIDVPVPNLSISGNSLSVNGGNTVTLPTAAAQSLAVSGQSLNITGANTITLPSASLVGTGAANVATLGANSYSIDVPVPNLSISGNSLSVNGGNTVTLPTAAAQSLAVNGQSLNITGANTITLPSASLIGTGAANVATLGPNSYSIDVPQANLALNGNSLSISGGNTVTIAPTLAMSGNTLQVGPPTNTIMIPPAPAVALTPSGGGINIIPSGTNSFVLDVPSTSLVPGTNVTINGAHPLYTVNATPTLNLVGNLLTISGGNAITLPSNTIAAVSVTVVGGGATTVGTVSANSYSVSSEFPTVSMIAPNTLSVNTGGSVTIAPTLSVTGNVLTVGPATNTIALPGATSQSLALNGNSLSITGANTITLPSASLIGTGAANVATLGPNSYSIDVPVPNLTISGNSLSVNGGNTVTLPSATAQSLAVNGQSLNITGANTITLPSASLIGTGAANVATLGANSYSINVPVPNLSITGNSLSVNGGNTVTLPSATAQSLAVNGQSLNITGANTITLPSASLIGTGAANVATLGPNSYSINVPVPNLSITGNSLSVNGGNTVTLPSTTAQSLAVNGQSLNITGANTITLPSASLIGTGAANVATLGPNSYSIDVPVPNLSITGNSLSVNGGNTVTLPTAAAQSLAVNGQSLNITGANTITLPSASLIGTGAANVATLGANSYSINVPVPNLTVSGNSLSVNGGNTVTLPTAAAQSLAVNGQSLNITGANTITLPSASLIGTGAANIATLGPNSYSIDVPQTSLSQGTGILVTGAFPNFIISAQPTLGLSGNNLSISGGNTVTLPTAPAQSLAVNGQSLNITGANTITLPSASLIGTGAANVATLGPNSYSIDVPVPNLTVSGNSLSVNGGNTVTLPSTPAQSLAVNGQSLNITGANTITLPSASLVGTGAANVASLSANSFSINVPVPNLSISGNSLSVNGANTVVLPSTPNTTISGTGAAQVVPLATNNYSINVPQTSLIQGTNIVVSGGFPNYTINALPTLTLIGSNLSISGGNTVTLPAAPTVTGTGAATVTGGPNYTVNVPVPAIAITTLAGTSSVTSSGSNFTINVPSAITPTMNGGGLAIASQTGSALQISVTPYSYTASTGALGSGTNVINITQTLGITGTTLNSGPSTNSVDLGAFSPWRQATNAVTLATSSDFVGIGTAVPGAKLHLVGSGSTGATSAMYVQNSGLTPLFVINNNGKVGIGSTSLSEELQVETGANTAVSILGGVTSNANLHFGTTFSHTLGSIKYDLQNNNMNFWTNGTNRLRIDQNGLVGINNASPTERLDVVGNVRFSGSLMPNNNPGTSGQLLISAGGSSATPTWGSVTYNNSTGVFSIGTNTYAIQPALALSGTTLTSGPSTNSVNLSALSPWRQGASSVTLATSSDFVGIGTNAPGAKLHLVGSGSTGASQALNVQNSSLADMFTILNNGRVGIGTVTPTEMLDVVGNIKMSGAFMPANNAGTAGQVLISSGTGAAPSWSTTGLLNNGTANYIPKWTSATGLSSTSQIYDNGSHVGIGTTAPNWNGTSGKVLSVAGQTNYSGYNAAALELIGSSLSTSTVVASVDFNSLTGPGTSSTAAKISVYRGGTQSMGDFAISTNNGTSLNEAMRIDQLGDVGIGTSNPSQALDIHRNGTGATARIATHWNFSNSGGALNLTFSRGTETTPSAILNSDGIGWINFEGYYGGGYAVGAWIKASATENWSSTSNIGTKLEFMTRTIGSPSNQNRMAITSSGGVAIGSNYAGSSIAPTDGLIIEGNTGIGTSIPDATLNVAGTLDVGLNNTVNNGTYGFAIGTSNVVSGAYSSASGISNTVTGAYSSAIGGYNNINASGSYAAAIGYGHSITNGDAVALGTSNTIGGYTGMAFGSSNTITTSGHRATVIGNYLSANHVGALVLGDWAGGSTSNSLTSTAADQLSARFNGGYRFFTDAAQTPSVGIFISAGGNFGIGNASPGYQLHVEKNTTGTLGFFDNNSIGAGVGLDVGVTTMTTTSGTRKGLYSKAWYGQGLNYGVHAYAYGGTTSYGVFGEAGGPITTTTYGVYASGNFGGTGLNLFASDRKLKKDIQPLSGALDQIMLLQPKTYYMKTEEYDFMNFPNDMQYGLIAQEVAEIFPTLVKKSVHPAKIDRETDQTIGEDVEYMALNYNGLTPIMIQAIKEQQQQIEELKKVLAEQQKLIDQLLKK